MTKWVRIAFIAFRKQELFTSVSGDQNCALRIEVPERLQWQVEPVVAAQQLGFFGALFAKRDFSSI
ncbi:hypothetical protein [Terricaulis sp.]|uniref:hypothetical protein n=1 Tax=Terricaulis sp. TaxID=2768686 RepID=UPI00378426C1